MTIAFSDAKNGEKTCALDGKHFHSSYNPTREAEQFVKNLSAPFNPSAIIIIEPALSYCVPFLRTRFTDATLCVVRLCADFSAYDGAWDDVFAAVDTLSDQLFSRLGEETLCATLFFAWQPSERIFAEKTQAAWQSIKTAVLKSRDVLATRSFFAKRWIKNTVRFCAHVRQTAIVQKGTSDIVVAASGPSLRTSLPQIAAHRAQFFLIAVSSALLPLLHAGITPDVVISTDGGYWAKKHLAQAGYDVLRIPFAIAAEGACPTDALEKQTIVPLFYDDGMEKTLFTAGGISAMSAARNGTVSGTAVEYALALTSGNVYACGLDLANVQGFQHTQPNALEQENAAKDNRVRTKHTRIAAAECSSQGALEIYRNWFISHSERLGKRLFRLSNSYDFSYSLRNIRDIDWDFFAEHVTKIDAAGNALPKMVKTAAPTTNRVQAIKTALHDAFVTTEYDGELCPVETLMQKRAATQAERDRYAAVIAEKKTRFAAELERLL